MSHRLKKKDSPTSLAFTQENVVKLLNLTKDSTLCNDFSVILTCATNGKDQLSYLKELSGKLKNGELQDKQNIFLLCSMFVQCMSRHPMRRTLAAILQSMSQEECLKKEVKKCMSGILSVVLALDKDANQSIRENTEIIAGLMENFKIGDEIVQDNYNLVLVYLQHALQQSFEMKMEHKNAVQQTQWMQNILAILKTTVAGVQKCENLTIDFEGKHSNLLLCLKGFLTLATNIIHHNFILDCQCAAGMLFPGIALLLPENPFSQFVMFISHWIKYGNETNFTFKPCALTKILLDAVKSCFDSHPTRMLLLLHSLLVKLPVKTLHNNHIGCSPSMFEEIFIERLIDNMKTIREKNCLILSFKTIAFWVNMAHKEIEKEDFSPHLIDILTSHVISHLFTYIDHKVDTIRHIVNATTKECFLILTKTNKNEIIDTIAKEYFSTDLKSRGNISIICHLTEFARVEKILNICPTLAIDVINLLANVDLAPHACDLYNLLSKKHFHEVQQSSKNISYWITMWVDNIYSALSGDNKEIKTNLSLRAMKNMGKDNSLPFDTLCGTGENKYRWRNLIDLNHMKMCLTHMDGQIRLDTLSLICNSSKTTDAVCHEDVVLLKYFLNYNMASESPSFRQQTVTNLKKILLRIVAHSLQMEKAGMLTGHRDHVGVYGQFLSWLISFCFENLYSSAPYCQVSLLLEVLLLVSAILHDSKDAILLTFITISDRDKVGFTDKLINCFDDTYDPNRLMVYRIFAFQPLFATILSNARARSIYQNTLERVSSPQPDISSIAAYYINFLALTICKDNLKSVYVDSDEKHLMNEHYFNSSNTVLFFLDNSMAVLKDQLSVMKSSLVSSSQNAPLYGILYCIRMLFQLQGEKIKQGAESNFSAFAQFLQDLVEAGIEIIEYVSPYVSSDAPEGHLCDASLAEVFQQLTLDEVDTNKIEFQAQVARMLLVCCWRSMKEVSLLLGVIVSNFSSVCSKENILLPKSLILKMWDMFCNILLRSKHAGAYELASLGFIKLCSVLWSSDDVQLQAIPSNSVKTLIEDLLSRTQYDNAQVTRRSAGLPFYLQALCTTEPAIKAKESLTFLMVSLTDLCKSSMGKHDVNKLVISLNILRAFYKDTKLCEDIFPYISDGVVIAVKGFSSSNWAIRNSCTILFSALMQRIFGVKKFKMTGREFFSRFPALFTFLLEQANVMVQKTTTDEAMNDYLHPSIFPVLLLLSHLYPATLEGTDSLMHLGNFVPHVRRCASSSVYKTRTMAAKAFTPLISVQKSTSCMQQLVCEIQELKNDDKTVTDQNTLHGLCLQLCSLLERDLVTATCEDLETIVSTCSQLSWICQFAGVCFVTKAVYLDIVLLLYHTDKFEGYKSVLVNVTLYLMETVTAPASEKIGYALFLRNAISFVCTILKTKGCVEELQWNHLKGSGEKSTQSLLHTCAVLVKSHHVEVRSTVLQLICDCPTLFHYVPSDFLTAYMEITFQHDVGDRSYPKMIEALASLLAIEKDADFDLCVQLWNKWYNHACVYGRISDTHRVAVVKFLAVFLKLCRSLSQEIDSLTTVFNQMWCFIEESSHPKQCNESRHEVAKMLYLKPVDNVYNYFICCINLLKDSDAEIREAAACNVYRIVRRSSDDDFYRPQPSVVIELLFNTVISKQISEDVNRCTAFLIRTMLQIESTGIKDAVRGNCEVVNSALSNRNELLKKFVVFEEGKDNPYYDEVEICRLAFQVLTQNRLKLNNEDSTIASLLSYCQSYVDTNKYSFRSNYIRKFLEHVCI
ncbi:thyroid adenoma-associated protein homolog isoform X2 [Hydractinia symbiolongicarpus]|uniref:thyroid adenoma-associated protein homolog isoform X2 n=1 Tax=Hydractinia symbiolongicarpus TaxID=13093 RepID=UPI0025513D98|nr:thyroid adenoma-associated protein homolog isoform X2 [Hydractinia symbiolongicarpus]